MTVHIQLWRRKNKQKNCNLCCHLAINVIKLIFIYITKVTASAFVFTQLWTPDPNLHWTLPTGNERHNRSWDWETSMRWCYCGVTDSVNRINSKIMNYQYHCISRCIHWANCLQNIHLLRTVCQTVQSAQQGLGCYGHAVQTQLERG